MIVNYRWVLGVNVIFPGLFAINALNVPDPDQPNAHLEMYVYGEEFGRAARIMRDVAAGELTDAEGFRMLTDVLQSLNTQGR